MSDYFDASANRISAGSLAQSSEVNAIRDETGAGFDKLPPAANVKANTADYGTESGTANAYALTMPFTQTAYVEGMRVSFNPGNTNTAASTVNVDGLGTKAIKRPDGTDVESGDILTGQIINLQYNGTNFVFTGGAPASFLVASSSGPVLKTEYDANTILAATSDDTPTALTIAEQRVVGRITAGSITGLTAAQIRTLINVEDAADVTDATNVNAAGAVMESDYNANTILAATSDDTPTALTIAEQRVVGRITAGNITGLTAAQIRTLINVEEGATADQSAAEILTAIKTVDGAGTGLDADLLDGKEAADFPLSNATTITVSSSEPGSPATNDIWFDIS